MRLERNEPLIIEDVGADDICSPDREPARVAGYRAIFSAPLKSRGGELLGTITTCFREPHRPTEREVRTAELFARQAADFVENARLKRAFQEADRRKDEALAALAHELRNPLGVIVNAAHVMKTKCSFDPKTVQFCNLVGRQARLMARLGGDMIAMSRPAAAQSELKFESLDINTCMEAAGESVRMIVEEHEQELTLIPPREPITLKADSIRVEQILVNLLINASRCTHAGGKITLQANEEGGAVVFRVRDTGVGISPEMITRIFDPFVRGDVQAWPERNGLGLGLTLVKRFVERHHGTVTAHSAGVGMGSEFVVRLPCDWAETNGEPVAPGPHRWSPCSALST
jgi:signal transduction histidine kinase